MRGAELAQRRLELEASLDSGRRELERALVDLRQAVRDVRPLGDLAEKHCYGLLLAAFAVGVRLGYR